jgi:hypothetical protein
MIRKNNHLECSTQKIPNNSKTDWIRSANWVILVKKRLSVGGYLFGFYGPPRWDKPWITCNWICFVAIGEDEWTLLFVTRMWENWIKKKIDENIWVKILYAKNLCIKKKWLNVFKDKRIGVKRSNENCGNFLKILLECRNFLVHSMSFALF